MGTYSLPVLALVLNIIAFFYLQAWRPVAHLVRSIRLSREIRAYRVAGLLLLLCMVSFPAHAQHANPVVAGVIRDADYEAARRIAKANGINVAAWDWNAQMGQVQYSRGDDALVQKWVATSDGITGYAPVDNAIVYVWNNCGKLMLVFGLLALASILNSKLKSQNECYGDVLRQEAAERWEEETDDDSIHNPFDSPEGMQPTTQYVPVRSRR